MFVCPVPKISQVMMKWCRRASHLGRLDLLIVAQRPLSYYTNRYIYFMWHNGRRATQLGRLTLWHNGRRATTQIDRFTLCGTTAAELNNLVSFMHAPGVAHIFRQ